MGDTGKTDMPSGRLAFATRHVDLMAVGMRAPLALCADGIPYKAWEKLDQMVVRVQGAPGSAVHCLRKVLHNVRHVLFSLPETLDTEDGGGDNTSGYLTVLFRPDVHALACNQKGFS